MVYLLVIYNDDYNDLNIDFVCDNSYNDGCSNDYGGIWTKTHNNNYSDNDSVSFNDQGSCFTDQGAIFKD